MKPARLQSWTATAILTGLSVVFLSPLMWMLSTSLKSEDRVQTSSTQVIPHAWFITDTDGALRRVKPLMVKEQKLEVQAGEGTFADGSNTRLVERSALEDRVHLHTANYTGTLQTFNMGRYLVNTLLISFACVAGTIVSCSLVAYGLACVQWKGRQLLFWTALATMMLPAQVTMIPVFVLFSKLGWYDTYLPLIVPSFLANAFFVFLLRQFYLSMPAALIEAARIDGCSDLRIWATIVLPLSTPALMVVGLFTFLGSWNNFFGPLIYLKDERKYTLPLALAQFQGQYSADWGKMMALSLLMTLPIIVLFFFTQRTFIQGVKLSGIKG